MSKTELDLESHRNYLQRPAPGPDGTGLVGSFLFGRLPKGDRIAMLGKDRTLSQIYEDELTSAHHRGDSSKPPLGGEPCRQCV